MFHEFRHPTRIRELNLAPHLERATATLSRVDGERFFGQFVPPDVRTESAASWSIVYFYEPFLEAFAPELRKELGVWYTPWEIVRYQVKKVDQILRQDLGCSRGFADERVVVLDPCCGTGAYLIGAPLRRDTARGGGCRCDAWRQTSRRLLPPHPRL